MISVRCCPRVAGVVMILASLSGAGDAPGVDTNSKSAVAPPTSESRLAQSPNGLGMRRPYERGKVPVIFIHGLWGFPHLWERMIEDLEAEPLLRRRYQFWTFSYASGDPIPFSAHMLRQSVRQARRLFDPDGTDAAFDQMVLVGHSLGGILAKMMAQDSRSRIWQTVSDRPVDRIVGPPEDCQLIHQAFFYKPVPEVRRLIFIATPHCGSPLVRGVVRDVGTRICDRANRFREARNTLLAQNEPDFFVPGFRGEYPTAVGELAPGNPLLTALCDLEIDPSVHTHSIIFDLRQPPVAGAGDGIVPYSSSHLESADSEVLVHAHHISLNSPEVIGEARRILRDHAGIGPASRTEHRDFARDNLESRREKRSGAFRPEPSLP
jgi:pimeloyl-ACP methyl ester carboxylesterase